MKNTKFLSVILTVLIATAGFFLIMQCNMGVDGDSGGEGADFDSSNYYTKEEVESLLDGYYTKIETEEMMGTASAGVYAIASGDSLTVNSGTFWTPMSFNFEHVDTSFMFSAPDSEIYCTDPGVYLVTAHVRFPDNATGIRGVKISENTMYNIGNELVFANAVGSGRESEITTTMVLGMEAGNWVGVDAYQDSDVDFITNVQCWLSVVKLGN